MREIEGDGFREELKRYIFLYSRGSCWTKNFSEMYFFEEQFQNQYKMLYNSANCLYGFQFHNGHQNIFRKYLI